MKPTEYEWSCGIKVFFDFPKSAPGGPQTFTEKSGPPGGPLADHLDSTGTSLESWGPWSPMQLIRQLTPHSKDYFRSLGNFAHHGNWEVWYMDLSETSILENPKNLKPLNSVVSHHFPYFPYWHYGIFHVPPASLIGFDGRSCLHGSRSLPAWR